MGACPPSLPSLAIGMRLDLRGLLASSQRVDLFSDAKSDYGEGAIHKADEAIAHERLTLCYASVWSLASTGRKTEFGASQCMFDLSRAEDA